MTGAPNVRAVVHDQDGRTIVHLYNLNIQRLTSFEDKVTPATDVGLSVATPPSVRSVRILTADTGGTSGSLEFQALGAGDGAIVAVHVGRIAAEKNLALAIQAFRALQQIQPHARMVFVGDGPLRVSLAQANPDR